MNKPEKQGATGVREGTGRDRKYHKSFKWSIKLKGEILGGKKV